MSDEQLHEDIGHIKGTLVSIDNCLKKLNDKVDKNTKFRIRTSAYLATAGVGLPILVSFLLNKYL